MPVVSMFYGIVIKMYFREHGVPHLHALYGEYNAVFDIQTLEMIEGDLPVRATRMVKEWAGQYQTDLLYMWQTQEFKKLPGFDEEVAMMVYPKVKAVQPLEDYRLQVVFDNAVCKVYYCNPLLDKPVFAPLADRWLFLAVRVDPGGYGISWNDDIDLAESELW